MGLRSPQEMAKVNIQRQGSVRFQGAVAPEIDKTFLKTTSSVVEEMRKAQLETVKTMADNDAEFDVITARAELAQASGLNALDKSITIREKLQRQLEKRKSKIPEQFHPYIENVYQKKLNKYNKFAIPHTLGEVNKANTESEKTFTANSVNEAIESSANPEEFSFEAIPKVKVAAARVARRQFGDDPELVDAAVSRVTSETIRRSIEQQAFLGRFDHAQGLFDNYGHELSPADRVKAIKLMDQARDDLGTKEASDLATKAFVDYEDSPTQAQAFLEGASRNDKVLRAAKAFYDMKLTAKKTEKEIRVKAIESEVYKQAALGRDVQQLIYQMEPGEERNKMVDWYNKTKGGKTIATDFNAVTELTERISNAYSANQLPDDLLESYRGKISPSDMKPIEAMYLGLKTKDNQEARRVHQQAFKIVQNSVESWAKANRVYGQERGKLELAAMDEVNRIMSFNPKISSEELDVRVRSLLREKGKVQVVKPPMNFFGMDVPFTGSVKEKVNDNLAPDDSPTVHPYWLNEIQKKRPNLTELQKNIVIKKLIDQGVDVSRPQVK